MKSKYDFFFFCCDVFVAWGRGPNYIKSRYRNFEVCYVAKADIHTRRGLSIPTFFLGGGGGGGGHIR